MNFPAKPKIKTYRNFPVRTLWKAVNPALYDNGECVLWKGQKKANGSGSVMLDGVSISLRRYIYALYKGAIGEDLFVRSICGKANCVKPAHLKIFSNVGGKDTDLLIKRCAALYRRRRSPGEIARMLNISLRWTSDLLAAARRAKLLLPVEAEGCLLDAEEKAFYRNQGYRL